jgi:DNA-binding transcriptional MerR regulator/effector-binding domain-containing protein
MKFSIGEFSRITALSIKSLRLYHEKGILVPAQVDEFTNYRYYDESNYEAARSINILKRYGFSLAEIKEVMDSCEEESDIFEFLEKKLASVQKQIQQYKEISHEIEVTIMAERERNMNPKLNFEIEEKELSTILIAGYRMKGKYSEIGEGFGVLGKAMGRHINGKAMMLCYDEEFKENADFEACFPVRKGESKDKVAVRELPGGKCVSLIHKGPYDTIGESYKKAFAYVNEKKYKSLIPSREVYIKGPGMIFRGNPNNYITEIQILVEA